ncbi:MAG: YWFCY domain-containing protein, partial [Mangrovibacterium sp.]
MMQQEDDLRGLAKIMEFMRAISIILTLMNCYWFGYFAIVEWQVNIAIVDRILLNFNRTAGLFENTLYTKLFALLLLALSCLGTKGVKDEKISWQKIQIAFILGLAFFFLNWWMLELPISSVAAVGLYCATMTIGYVLLLMAGLWTSRLLKNRLMDDPFNLENESFMQETRLMQSEYSINLPTKF